VIITAHLKRLRVSTTDKKRGGEDEEEGEAILTHQSYPSALGQVLPPEVGSYFNVVLMADKRGAGAAAQRFLRTQPTSDVDLKVPLPPKGLPAELDLNTGLAKLVTKLQSMEE
jgi:hypothetical protein